MKLLGTGKVQHTLVAIFGDFVDTINIVAILNTFNALWSIFITFYAWNKLKLDILQENGYFCGFSVNILWEQFFYSPNAANNGCEMLLSLVQVFRV